MQLIEFYSHTGAHNLMNRPSLAAALAIRRLSVLSVFTTVGLIHDGAGCWRHRDSLGRQTIIGPVSVIAEKILRSS